MAEKTFRPYDPAAAVELPGDLRQYLPSDHQVFLIEDLVESLDLTPITSVYEQGDGRGQPPYHPVLLSKLLLYAYCEGETSSRKIMRKTYEDIAYRVLCVDQHPDFRTISDFRERHLAAFRVLFRQTVWLAQALGQVRLEHVAQDGSKILANASKHKAMSYERMGQTEQRLTREIEAILAQARATDAAEDARYGRDGSGEELPAALQREVDFRQARRARIRAAQAALEARAAAEAAAQEPADPDRREPPHRLPPEPPDAAPVPSSPGTLHVVSSAPAAQPTDPPFVLPAATAQYCFTDPDSRIMPSSQGFVQAYNAQAAVDHYRQIIVACDVTDATVDTQQLLPLFDQVRANTGGLPAEASADSGYWSEENVTTLQARGIAVYLPPPRPRPRAGQDAAAAVHTSPCKARMAALLATPAAARRYSLRKETAEPVFGQLKAARGLRRFCTRGLDKVRGEWALWCLTHNLRKLAAVLGSQPAASRTSLATSPVHAARTWLRRPGATAGHPAPSRFGLSCS